MANDYSAFEGWEIKGRPALVTDEARSWQRGTVNGYDRAGALFREV